ncbi:hypothetical protein AGABI1DRAFT_69486 [Agaricus bisporus var. burnettii JB137-S8]|uniref:DNA repair protein rhp7 treble clef domain-containing protein n=1 Tax=Agaricus bisporus var. burnettii (strain JB137-S8 / ATCC MYA-4627 / FGSC 10392) TaxID=597362 RepID=K5Y573_AGABU|nr:uncharacterized protein AGABI1DRAFT_69486 [Agaricus bisporus var. burnettii JB137-S8]EKM83235.1 hypothetical protein AGABI1DRAFT_69486 [Agaricus bisporus var. burnettii JB137-S8]
MRGIKGSDDDYVNEDDERYNALSSRPAPGSFSNCAHCEKRFTVTIYTSAAIPGPGWLCHPCAKEKGIEPLKKGSQSRKKKTVADRRTITTFEEKRFPTLVSLCIQLISKHIDDVESLGDIGTMNVEAISKTLSKNRSLTSENAQLFYSTTNATLTLYDATNLSPDAFSTLGYLNSNLTSLRLDFCGQINDEAFNSLSTSLPALTEIELLGPFLVKPAAWKGFFTAHPNLSSFLITQSPRFDLDCLICLVSNCGSNLRALRLKEIGKLDNEFLQELSRLGQDGNTSQLAYLDLSEPEKSCDEKAMIELLYFIGRRLTYLNVSNHIIIGDDFLAEGLLPHTKTLRTLVLDNLPELTDKGVSKFFQSWNDNPPLVHLSLSRNHALADKSLQSILDHSGTKLEELNLNGWKDVGEEILTTFATEARELRKLDVGWIREVTDFVVKAWVDGVPEKSKNKRAMELDAAHAARKGGCFKLEEVKVWGCNRITLNCPRKRGMNIYGVETPK